MSSNDPHLNSRAKLFLANTVVFPEADCCALWPYRRDQWGTPLVYLPSRNGETYKGGTQKGRIYNAAVVVLEDTGRPRPSPQHVPHRSCGHGDCIAPLHLSWKVRMPVAKLSGEQRQAIRQDGRPARDVARQYGVSRQTVWKIKRGEVNA